MPAPVQRQLTVYMRRKPAQADVNTAKAKGAVLPPAKPLGTFSVPYTTVDQTKEAARGGAAERISVAPSKLTVSFGPDGDGHKIIVYAPAEGA